MEVKCLAQGHTVGGRAEMKTSAHLLSAESGFHWIMPQLFPVSGTIVPPEGDGQECQVLI